MAFDWRLRGAGAPAFSELQAGFHKAVGFSEGHAALIRGATTSAFGAEFAQLWAAPHLRKWGKTLQHHIIIQACDAFWVGSSLCAC